MFLRHSYSCITMPNLFSTVSASTQLIRIKTPWLLDSLDWTDDRLVRKAVLWLCGRTKNRFLKLTGKDYNDNGLSDLLAMVGAQYKINIKVFNDLQHTITGWPGGKPGVDDTFRPERLNRQKSESLFSVLIPTTMLSRWVAPYFV